MSFVAYVIQKAMTTPDTMETDSRTSKAPRTFGGAISEMYYTGHQLDSTDWQCCKTHQRCSQCKSANSDTPYRPSYDEHRIVLTCRLKYGTNVKNDNHGREGLLARDLIRNVREEETTQEATKFQHTRHESFPESRLAAWDCPVELVHDIDDGDDALVIAKRETSQGSKKGGAGRRAGSW